VNSPRKIIRKMDGKSWKIIENHRKIMENRGKWMEHRQEMAGISRKMIRH
jgi:hypothetical protein